MSYNVGPEYKRSSTADHYTCDDCDEIVKPEWDGCEGGWRCPVCYSDIPDYEEAKAMPHTTRQLAIIASTVSIHLTAEEQRAGEAFICGLHNMTPPYRSRMYKAAHAEGGALGKRFNYLPYIRVLDRYRLEEGLSKSYNERHAELDQ